MVSDDVKRAMLAIRIPMIVANEIKKIDSYFKKKEGKEDKEDDKQTLTYIG